MKYETDLIFSFEDHGTWLVFTSPDGVGKIFHTNEREAKEQTGIRSVVYLIDFCPEHYENGSCIHSDHTI